MQSGLIQISLLPLDEEVADKSCCLLQAPSGLRPQEDIPPMQRMGLGREMGLTELTSRRTIGIIATDLVAPIVSRNQQT